MPNPSTSFCRYPYQLYFGSPRCILPSSNSPRRAGFARRLLSRILATNIAQRRMSPVANDSIYVISKPRQDACLDVGRKVPRTLSFLSSDSVKRKKVDGCPEIAAMESFRFHVTNPYRRISTTSAQTSTTLHIMRGSDGRTSPDHWAGSRRALPRLESRFFFRRSRSTRFFPRGTQTRPILKTPYRLQ